MTASDIPPRKLFVIAIHDEEFERFHTVHTTDAGTVDFFFRVAGQGAVFFAFEAVGDGVRLHRASPSGMRDADRQAHAAMARRAEWSAAHSLGMTEHADSVAVNQPRSERLAATEAA